MNQTKDDKQFKRMLVILAIPMFAGWLFNQPILMYLSGFIFLILGILEIKQRYMGEKKNENK